MRTSGNGLRRRAAYNEICEQRNCLNGTFRSASERKTIDDDEELRYRAYNEPRATTTTTAQIDGDKESVLETAAAWFTP